MCTWFYCSSDGRSLPPDRGFAFPRFARACVHQHLFVSMSVILVIDSRSKGVNPSNSPSLDPNSTCGLFLRFQSRNGHSAKTRRYRPSGWPQGNEKSNKNALYDVKKSGTPVYSRVIKSATVCTVRTAKIARWNALKAISFYSMGHYGLSSSHRRYRTSR